MTFDLFDLDPCDLRSEEFINYTIDGILKRARNRGCSAKKK